MAWSRRYTFIAGGLAGVVLAGTVLVYSAFRRNVGAEGTLLPDVLSDLPAGAPALVYADLAEIRESSFYKQRPDHGPITLPNRDYADFIRSTGFDFEKDLDRVGVASWPAGPERPAQQIILIADGRFDRRKIRDYALHNGKTDRQQGRDVYLFPTDSAAHWNTLCFLSDRKIAIVSGPSIAPLLANPNDEAQGQADPARERAKRVAGAAMFAVIKVPPIPDAAASGGVGPSKLMELARSVQWLTLAARPEGNSMHVSLEGDCQSAADAHELAATLEVARMIGSASLEKSSKQANVDQATLDFYQGVLKNAEINTSEERVRIRLEVGPELFKIGNPAKAQ